MSDGTRSSREQTQDERIQNEQTQDKRTQHEQTHDKQIQDARKTVKTVLPTDSPARKSIPIVSGCLDYFPAALACIAEISRAGNDQHNPGQPLHWARGKSMDHVDCIGRHLLERGTLDTDGMRHTGKMAWRALALLQEELEAAGAPKARAAK
jgi:hypothetical protein